MIYGDVNHSVLFAGVTVGKGSMVRNSILMPNVKIGENTVIENAIIAENTVVGDNCYIGYSPDSQERTNMDGNDITVIGENLTLPSGYKLDKGIMVDSENFLSFQAVI
jgi:glucose-1-phosphate adenylyltransferase